MATQYQHETEQVAMMNVPHTATPRSLLFTEDVQIQRTRKTLLSIVPFCLGIAMGGVITSLIRSVVQHRSFNTHQLFQVGRDLGAIPFYIFGMIVIYRYYPTALRVFAALVVIIIILTSIPTLNFLLVIIRGSDILGHPDHVEDKGIMIIAFAAAVIVIGMNAAHFVLTVIMVKLALKLARLIDANRKLTNGQV